ncbi:MAG: ABC transporter ATP-binding protein [Anaerolineaceae bacterium]|nr:ABC transporter ATP-binding protein [Anaerolineaceae bacterium]MDE0328348.1 ABC transporter ATP-binding protein [Anaerolineaceae bacterium]
MPDPTWFEEEEFGDVLDGRTLRRILGLVRPHWRHVAGFILAITIISILESWFTFQGKRIVDEVIVPQDTSALREILITYLIIVFGFALGVFTFIYLTGLLGQRIQYELRQRLFHHLQTLSLAYFDRTPVGWIMSRLTSDTERIAELVTWGLLDTTWAVTNMLAAASFMMIINWRLALVVLAVMPVLIAVALWFRQKIVLQFRLSRRINSIITGALNENITGVRVVKALTRERANLREFRVHTDDMYRASYRAHWLAALFLPLVQLISALALSLIVLRGGQLALEGALTIGSIQAFISYLIIMLWPIQDLARVFASLQQAVASAERTFSLIDTQPDLADRPGAYDPGTLKGDIEFDDVDFQYEPEKPVLQGFSLTVRQGETIAIVGPTGAGKTSIVNLVCRFYEPGGGAIRINGVDYTRFTMQAIQSRIGMVLQTPQLFSGTILENIRYGSLGASDDEVYEAGRLAGADDFVQRLEKGYESGVGEGGVLLSTGQKQLISLARAILSQPDIFIMDEATSSVDTLTEALIQQGMEALMKRSTTFVIAHRLSTIRRADRILVLQDGRIEELGTHRELLRRRGHYYRLYTRQFREQADRVWDSWNGATTGPALAE